MKLPSLLSFRTTPLAMILAAGLLLSGCHDREGDMILDPAAPLLSAAPTAAPVLRFADFGAVGESSLVRTKSGVRFQVRSEELVPGHAYTLWIVIYNDISGCLYGTPGASNCGAFDVVNPDARPDMMYAGGFIAGNGGQGTLAGSRRIGDASGSINGPVGMPAFALENPMGAEIHFVVHDHGPKLPGFLPDMIQTVDGGCTDAGIPVAGAPSPWNDHAGFGRRGPNTCESIQFAVHVP